MLSNLVADVRYTIRTLRRHPGFSIAAIAPIALGVGINTGIFSILDAIAWRPVASPHPTELVSVYQQVRGVSHRFVHGSRSMFSTPEYRVYRDRAQTLSGVIGYSRYWTMTLGGQAPQEIRGALVTCNYFEVLQVRPVLGAGFTPATCDAPDAPPAVVLSHELWTRAFAADRDIVHKTIVLDGRTVGVAGVAPEGFEGIDIAKVSVFAPTSIQPLLRPDSNMDRDPDTSWLTIVGRRRAGVALANVRAELAVIAAQIDSEHPGRATAVSVAEARALSLPEMRRGILSIGAVVLAAFALVLLIACANVANLLLARASGRAREIAVRLSVGAGRGRLVRQLLTESAVIALVGGLAGSFLAWWSFQGLLAWLLAVLPVDIPSLAVDAGPNLAVLSFAFGLSLLTGLLFGLAPALQASRFEIQTLLNRDSAGAGRQSGGWLRGALIGAQVAVCMVLLVSAGLLLRALYTAETFEPGFEYRDVVAVSFDLRGAAYDEARAATFQRQLIERVGELPGVEAVAQAQRSPLSPGRTGTMFRLPEAQQRHEIDFNTVSADYFSLVAIPIVGGRTFTAAELGGPSRAVIITESTARRHWPNQDPIGRTLMMSLGPDVETPLDIVGVARDAQVSQVGRGDMNYMYLPATPETQRGLGLLVRSRARVATLAPAILDTARGLAPGLVVHVNPLEDNLTFWRTLARIVAGLSGSLSVLALTIASVGVYGVVSYMVSRRLREIVIRMVLGASARDVQALVLAQTLRPVVIGVLVGVGAAAAAARLLDSVLFGVSRFDPLAFVGAPLCLLTVAAAATLLPTRLAVRRDAMTTLRHD